MTTIASDQEAFVNRVSILDLVLLAGLALAVRLIGVGIDHPPVGDEMFHVLAAQSWAADGTLAIADGVYSRAALFTKLVGLLYLTVGESLVAARLPALVFGLLWALLLFFWINRHAGRLPAWIAAGLFCIAPHAIELSLYSRMYTLHGFLFLLTSICVFELLVQRPPAYKSLLFCIICIISLGFAFHFQSTTAVGLLALSVAAVIDIAIQNRDRFRQARFVLAITLSLSLLAIFAAVLVYLYWDLFESLWKTFNFTAFAQSGIGIRFYHQMLVSSYPVLWLLFPIAAVLAIYRHPRAGMYCVTVFLVIFIIHSFAGRKAERYIYYGMPFLFATWGMAIAWLLPRLNRFLDNISENLRTHYLRLGSMRSFSLAFKGFFAAVGIAFIISGSGAFARTIHILNGESYYFGVRLSNWEKAVPILKDLINEAPVVVTTNFPKTLYYFDRFDVVFSPVLVADILQGREGDIDFRTGRPAIGTVESLRQVLESYPHGIFVAEGSEWRNQLRMTNEAADLLEQYARPVKLPAEARIVAYVW